MTNFKSLFTLCALVASVAACGGYEDDSLNTTEEALEASYSAYDSADVTGRDATADGSRDSEGEAETRNADEEWTDPNAVPSDENEDDNSDISRGDILYRCTWTCDTGTYYTWACGTAACTRPASSIPGCFFISKTPSGSRC